MLSQEEKSLVRSLVCLFAEEILIYAVDEDVEKKRMIQAIETFSNNMIKALVYAKRDGKHDGRTRALKTILN